MKEAPDKGMDPDILAEMHVPIKIIEKEIPDFLKKYSKEKIIDACIKKKAKGIIKTNREFRQLKKSLSAIKRVIQERRLCLISWKRLLKI